ncbi:MAG: hypothetical protein E6K85_07375 [Thaumarchaeota archaeon]|nr:MAG: hypothetical protein E6K85_07375 [Nitrososphaerota archaeon]
MPNVGSHDIRKIIFDNFNDTDQIDKYKELDDVLDFGDALLEMEKSGMLRPIAQNFNTRYYRLWNPLEQATCKACGFSTYFAPNEEGEVCPQCGAKM